MSVEDNAVVGARHYDAAMKSEKLLFTTLAHIYVFHHDVTKAFHLTVIVI